MKTQAQLCLLALALLSCAKSGKPAPPSPAHSLVAVEPVASLEVARQEIQKGSVTCRDATQCPANVGLLLAADAAGGLDVGSDALLGCTASLVGDDLALTNSHCIPAAVKLLPDLCGERVRLVLPASENRPEESFACARLLGFSSRETAMSPDLALLRLDRPTGRPPFALDRAGIEPGMGLVSFRVNPDLKRRTGELVSDPCIAAAGSFRMPVYRVAADSVVVTGDCQARAGNSGSPLVAADGKLRAVLQAELPLSEQLMAQWKPHLDGDAFAPLAMGTSLRCLASDPHAGWSWNDACAPITEDDVAAARPRLRDLVETEAYQREVEGLLLPFRGQSPALRWERTLLSSTALDRHERLNATCFEAEAPQTALQLPRYSISLRFNRYAQLTAPQVALEGTDTLDITTLSRCSTE